MAVITSKHGCLGVVCSEDPQYSSGSKWYSKAKIYRAESISFTFFTTQIRLCIDIRGYRIDLKTLFVMSNISNLDVAPLHSCKKRSISGACMSTLSRKSKELQMAYL